MNPMKILGGLLLGSCLTGCVGLMVQHPITTLTEEEGVSVANRTRTSIQAKDKCVRLEASTSDREIYRCDEGVRPMLVLIGAGLPLPLPYAGRHERSTYEITADTVLKRSKTVGSTGAVCGFLISDDSGFCVLSYRDKDKVFYDKPGPKFDPRR